VGVPRDKEAKRFYRAAEQRLEDATFLFSESVRRTTAAVYLAGYCVECLLKALILSQVAKAERGEVLQLFRGSKAHDYDWLRELYYVKGGARFPPAVVQAFSTVSVWGTEMRYQPGTIPDDDAEEFLAAVETIWDWADGRL
jgi:HEPN domain-containing protein